MTRVVALRQAILDGLPYIYVGRSGHGHSGYFGNMHRMGKPCSVARCNDAIHGRTEAIAEFRIDFYERLRIDAEYKHRIEALRGANLACPGNCFPRACHADVIAEYLNGLSDPSARVGG